MTDYSIFYKRVIQPDDAWPSDLHWDLFISAFNRNDRLSTIYSQVSAQSKHWLILPEYHLESQEYPSEDAYVSDCRPENEYLAEYLSQYYGLLAKGRICIDTSGFIAPYLMFLIRSLYHMGVRKFSAIYSEPSSYVDEDDTEFTDAAVRTVGQIPGFEGNHVTSIANDLLVIGTGYDHELVVRVAEHKDHARKLQVFGFPSLKADMYQQNILRASLAAEAVGSTAGRHPDNYFAPAYDPFITASVLSDIVRKYQGYTNLYLCPLSTQPQVLGFTIFYVRECQGRPVSMLYPYCNRHASRTTVGIGRTWLYSVEL